MSLGWAETGEMGTLAGRRHDHSPVLQTSWVCDGTGGAARREGGLGGGGGDHRHRSDATCYSTDQVKGVLTLQGDALSQAVSPPALSPPILPVGKSMGAPTFSLYKPCDSERDP